MSPASTDERLAAVEKRLEEFDALLETLMLMAARHPLGRQVLRAIAKKGGGG